MAMIIHTHKMLLTYITFQTKSLWDVIKFYKRCVTNLIKYIIRGAQEIIPKISIKQGMK